MNVNRNRFFALMWVVTLFMMRPLLPEGAFTNAFTSVYTVLAYGTYAAFYLAPTFVISWLVERFGHAKKTAAAVAIIGSGLTLILLFVDARIHSLYGFHINGFVINLVLTPGGLDSLGADASTNLRIVLLIAALPLLPVGLWFFSKLSFWPTVRVPRLIVFVFAALFVATLIERVMYGVGDIQSRGETFSVASSLPLHQPFTFRKFGKKQGLAIPRERNLTIKSAGRVQYPAQPLQIVPPARPPNVIWLVAESLRADALNSEVMPATWDAATKGMRFTRHFSGGNGTRIGMFSLFSGLPGTYWFAFLNEERGAAVIDVMLHENYDMHLFTAQKFTYPEFDRTIFARVPRDRMHEERQGPVYERDGRNVTRIIQTLGKRDPARPFFIFNFFESAHAPYSFPPAAVIRPNYARDLNYAELDAASLKRDIESIRARYINSVHALDMVLAPLWKYLDEQRLWENTIVIFTGDHGQEFMEKGRWGHNSEFVNEQVLVPLVLWVPGRAPEVDDRLSAHMDLSATVLPLLGVKNPASDYCLGYNLLEPPARTYTILSDWSRAAYVDKDIKVTVPMSAAGFFRQRVTDANDQPVPNPSAILQAKNREVMQVMQDIGRFVRKPSTAEAKK